MRLVLVSGMSGSVKSVAIRLLEDLGYYCIDNLPSQFLTDVCAYLSANGHPEVAEPLPDLGLSGGLRIIIHGDLTGRVSDGDAQHAWEAPEGALYSERAGRAGQEAFHAHFRTGDRVNIEKPRSQVRRQGREALAQAMVEEFSIKRFHSCLFDSEGW